MTERERIASLDNKGVVDEMQSDSPLARARAVFSTACARIDQASSQRRPIGIIEQRRMELEAVLDILEAAGLSLPSS